MTPKEAEIYEFIQRVHKHFGGELGKAMLNALASAPRPPAGLEESEWKSAYAAGSMTGLLELAKLNAEFHGMGVVQFAKALQRHGELLESKADETSGTDRGDLN